jgi:hypothetical protein
MLLFQQKNPSQSRKAKMDNYGLVGIFLKLSKLMPNKI